MNEPLTTEQLIRENQRLRDRLHRLSREQEEHRKARFMADAADQSLTMIDRNYCYESVNQAYCRARGQTPEELLGQAVWTVWGQDQFQDSIAPCLKACFDGQVASHENWFVFGKGNKRCFQVTYTPYRADNDAVTHAVVVTQDITDRKLAETALQQAHDRLERRVRQRTAELEAANRQLRREIDERQRAVTALEKSEERYRSVSRDMPAMVCRHLPDGHITFTNRHFQQHHQIDAHRPESINIKNFFSQAAHEQRLVRLAQLTPQRPMVTHEQRVEDPAGHTIWRQWTDRALFDHQGRAMEYQSVSIDITEKKEVEHKLQQVRKMEAIGTIAGGIAHDFNNLLMGIQGNVSLIGLEIDPAHRLHTRIKKIERLVERSANLTGQLLGYARGGKYVVRPLDMNELVSHTAALFGRTRTAIRIHESYTPAPCRVAADHNQIEQVLVNLYLNAGQAMSNKGDLYLKTGQVTIDETFVKPFEIRYGEYVRVSVTDTGKGIDPAIADRIFEPFFSTRDFGSGSGLGLASAFGIVKNHGGFVDFESRPGQGTTFSIYLPVCHQPLRPPAAPPADMLSGLETILLVDDEAYVLGVGVKMLEKMGHTVLQAASGKEAVNRFASDHQRIDLVILDLVMPEMDGKAVFERMRAIDPTVRVLLASGFSRGEADAMIAKGCHGFIQKPFSIEALSHAIRKVIDAN